MVKILIFFCNQLILDDKTINVSYCKTGTTAENIQKKKMHCQVSIFSKRS